jgi:hypothetical protein
MRRSTFTQSVYSYATAYGGSRSIAHAGGGVPFRQRPDTISPRTDHGWAAHSFDGDISSFVNKEKGPGKCAQTLTAALSVLGNRSVGPRWPHWRLLSTNASLEIIIPVMPYRWARWAVASGVSR